MAGLFARGEQHVGRCHLETIYIMRFIWYHVTDMYEAGWEVTGMPLTQLLDLVRAGRYAQATREYQVIQTPSLTLQQQALANHAVSVAYYHLEDIFKARVHAPKLVTIISRRRFASTFLPSSRTLAIILWRSTPATSFCRR